MAIDIDARLRFTTQILNERYPESSNSPDREKVLCFTHAVRAAYRGATVEAEVTQSYGDQDMRSWSCEECN